MYKSLIERQRFHKLVNKITERNVYLLISSIMNALNGKWKLINMEKIECYLKAIGIYIHCA